MTISIADDGRLALDGVESELSTIAGRLQVLAEQEQAPLFVRINSDANAQIRHLLRLITALEGLAAADVVLVVTPMGA